MENTNIRDLANYLLTKESMTHLKLQKLCYYCVAWNLVINKTNLLKEEDCIFEAWVHGPVSRNLYESTKEHSLDFINIKEMSAEIKEKFTIQEIEAIESVWGAYGEFTGVQLEKISHRELPWLEQREGLDKFDSSTNEISLKSMIDFYSKMYENEK